jgi:hypothetical protein
LSRHRPGGESSDEHQRTGLRPSARPQPLQPARRRLPGRRPRQARRRGRPESHRADGHGNLFGSIAFYKACKKEGVKPLLGIEAYVAQKSRFEKSNKEDNRTHHLTIIAGAISRVGKTS